MELHHVRARELSPELVRFRNRSIVSILSHWTRNVFLSTFKQFVTQPTCKDTLGQHDLIL